MKLILLTILSGLTLAACSAETTSTPSSGSNAPTATAASVPMSSLERGRKLYKRCVTCHTLEAGGRNKVGPNLSGIFGAAAGTRPDFNYSSAMAESGITWTDENLHGYIENPAKFMPKNRMSFVGLRKQEDRDAVFEYMRSEMAVK